MQIDRMMILTSVVLLISTTATAAEGGTVTSALSPQTRAVVIREMQAIDAAMHRIHTAVVTGDHATVMGEAQAIHDSFVLAQSLSDEQRAEIGALPQEFLAADRGFHQLAERLMEAGAAQDSRAERVWFEEMTRACVACHQAFAVGRFPGLARDGSDHTNR